MVEHPAEVAEDIISRTSRNPQPSKVVVKRSGLGCLTVVGIIFVVLKLLAVPPVAAWSWWWVLAPFWIPWAIMLAVFAIVLLLVAIAAAS